MEGTAPSVIAKALISVFDSMPMIPKFRIEWESVSQANLPYGLLEIVIAASSWFRECNSWTVLIIASMSLFWYARNFPPGPSFTYAWLWVGVLSTITGNTDANALFYLIGFGLITGWYTTQILQRDIWDRLLVYWLTLWPPWCVSTAVRFGDFVIHIVPFAYSLQFYRHVALHHVLQAIIYERVYFLAIENSVIGSGQMANRIYALHPPCSPQVFHCIQMLSTVGYFFAGTVCAGSGRQFLQALWLSLYVFIGFGTVGYFDSVAAKLPRDKDSLLTLLADWDEVNGKVTNYLQSLKEAVSQSLGSSGSPKNSSQQETYTTTAMALLFSLPSKEASAPKDFFKEGASTGTLKVLTASQNESHRPEIPPWDDLSHFLAYHFPPQLLSTAQEEPKSNGAMRAAVHVCPMCRQRGSDRMSGGTAQCEYDSKTPSVTDPSTVFRLLPEGLGDTPQSVQSLVDKIRNLEDVIAKLKAFWAAQHQELRSSSDRLSPMFRRPSAETVVSLHANGQRAQGLKGRSAHLRRPASLSRKGVRRMVTRKIAAQLDGLVSTTEHPSECSTRPSSQNTQRPPRRTTLLGTMKSIRSPTSRASSPTTSPSPSTYCPHTLDEYPEHPSRATASGWGLLRAVEGRETKTGE